MFSSSLGQSNFKKFRILAAALAVPVVIGIGLGVANAAMQPVLHVKVTGQQIMVVGSNFTPRTQEELTLSMADCNYSRMTPVSPHGHLFVAATLPANCTGAGTITGSPTQAKVSFTVGTKVVTSTTAKPVGATSTTMVKATTTTTAKATTTTTTPVSTSPTTTPTTVPSGSLASNAIFVSPSGNDSNAGTSQSAAVKTIAKAQTLARSKSGATVYLAGGTYNETSALALTSADSGITWAALPGSTTPVISGGAAITGWTQGTGNIWSAKVPSGTDFRELYVNGTWAQRARTAINTSGFSVSANGLTGPSAVASYKNPTDMEIVGDNQWKVFRCGVASVSGTSIVADSKCWATAQLTTYHIQQFMYLENAKELLDQPGEFYLDKSASTVYYMPRSGETMNTTPVDYPIVQQLVTGTGVSNVTFSGITFANAGYNAISANGYVSSQAASYQAGSGLAVMPAAIQFSASKSINFTNDVVKDIGSAGVDLAGGTQSSTITGTSFHDIGSAAIQLGGISNPNAAAASQDTGFSVTNNYVNNVGIEYPDAAAVFAGYVANTKINHNTITNVPYTAISMGWGWGTNSYAANNEVGNNSIVNYMTVLQDGGAIYTLSSQPGSTIHDNYAENGVHNNCLYPDQGSANMSWTNNVCNGVPQWLHIWTSSINNLKVTGNFYTSNSTQLNAGTSITLSNNTSFGSGSLPAAATTTKSAAGLSSSMAAIKNE